ncbi:hypothetical protein ACMU_07260 [Actibacterium mucosum KCTC 23349]|uniref:Major facilitator superfamily (MFS) profile domain-containing protein n=1 Tax=Actibacterium mucosum KCTC 23349 TaxID=1454373 RepID=A0A037ZM55_9RHOB|nr:MFS transporter [Actibacterium mucosum]KAJ56729.1 hypothetical protein ACMU_07260 [Actibacterium mucosum KCTC 23349]
MTQTPKTKGDSLAVWLLAVGQTMAYGSFYYVFAALLVTLEAETGWTKGQLALGPTLSILLAAALAPVSGRLVDRGRGGDLLSYLPFVGALGLAVLALAQSHAHWIIGWLILGVVQGGALYETCFAFLTRRLGEQARAAIIRVTLVAGFASALSYPAGAVLGEALGWRGALWSFAVAVLVVMAPVNIWGVIRLRRNALAGQTSTETPPGTLARAMRRPAFWLIAGCFGLMWMNHSLIVTYVMVLFQSTGAPVAMAVLAASCIGPSQVAGRVVLMLGQHRVTSLGVTRLTGLGSVLAMATLLVAGVEPLLIFVFAGLQGASVGLVSVMRPVVTAELLGREGFGAISGVLSIMPTAGMALAPVIGAGLYALGAEAAILWFALIVAGVAFVLTLMLRANMRAG